MSDYLFDVGDSVVVGRDYRLAQYGATIQFRYVEVIFNTPTNMYVVSGHPTKGFTTVKEFAIVPPKPADNLMQPGSVITGIRYNDKDYKVTATTKTNYVIQAIGGGQEWLIPHQDIHASYTVKYGIYV